MILISAYWVDEILACRLWSDQNPRLTSYNVAVEMTHNIMGGFLCHAHA